jgi:GH15 family glucan-1,4-alpha-glucosidase
MEFAPRFEYGLTIPHLEEDGGDLVARGGPVTLLLSATVPMEYEAGTAAASFKIDAGESADFALAFSSTYGEEAPVHLDVGKAIDETIESWRSWSELHTSYTGDYVSEVRLSALVLQGLTFQPSGAVIAAATTSQSGDMTRSCGIRNSKESAAYLPI